MRVSGEPAETTPLPVTIEDVRRLTGHEPSLKASGYMIILLKSIIMYIDRPYPRLRPQRIASPHADRH
jgi:hypothetical protein